MNNRNKCIKAISDKEEYIAKLPDIIKNIAGSCSQNQCFDNVNNAAIPSKENIIDIIELIKDILFPGYFGNQEITDSSLIYHIGDEVNGLFRMLSTQITRSIRHECLKNNKKCTNCSKRGFEETIVFLENIPKIREFLAKDVKAALDGDPAAKSSDEVIFSYPGFFAIMVYRVANQLHKQKIPLIPRIMTEYAHSVTGIDIHPGADIKDSFFIDHGTGVVIGETTVIGKNVRIYQGVTLGALSIRKKDITNSKEIPRRHPVLEDNVIVYSNATILGGDTIIGKNSVIGGNVWITESVSPNTLVFSSHSENIKKQRGK
ncbi:MAG: serine acetyltransferase [Candidatus Muirbacterium halophilum]|nr:serine acetyltransferase [Candidatus Muirbacterium halophilum]